ncbi:MAG: OmpH family outer membrane protein [Arachidicoccus sp.]|nr:OmpH family outer membrane protein [Arachidicoccus sp.]
MRKVIFSLLVIIAGFVAGKASAQTTGTKIGYFDSEQMANLMPEMKTVQTKIQAFQRDSLGTQKDQLDTLFNNAQNTYKNDSLAKKSASILGYDRQKLQELYSQEIQWSQYQQQATQNKYYELAGPTFQKVHDALEKAAKENHVTTVVKIDALEWIDDKQVINMFIPVAKILGVTLPNQNTTSPNASTPAAGK